jgi:hypothetical protein
MILPVRPRFKDSTTADIERLLPGPGRILVQVGDRVEPEDVVGEAEISDGIRQINFSQMFGVKPSEVEKVLTKKKGEVVYKGEPLAKFKRFLGLRQQVYISPVDGVVDEVSDGNVTIRFAPTEAKLAASFGGIVSSINEGQSLTISTNAAIIKGVVGAGEQRFGKLKVVGKGGDFLLPQDLSADSTDKIVVGGAIVTADTIEKALAIGVRGLVTGGVNFHETLGWVQGKDAGLTIMALEGYGFHHINSDLLEELEKLNGRYATINGESATLSVAIDGQAKEDHPALYREVAVGDTVRVVAGAELGKTGKVEKISVDEIKLDSSLMDQVITVKVDGHNLVSPWQNLEIVEVK